MNILFTIGILLVANHLLVSSFRGYLRVRKYKYYYQSVGRMHGAYQRGIKKRALRYTTFIMTILLTIFQLLMIVK